MREKLIDYGRDVFHSHELLEMLLYHAVRYKNTNPIAKRLIARFSTLDGVLSASKEELMTVDGVGERIADMLVSVGKIKLDTVIDKSEGAGAIFDDYVAVGEFFVNYFDSRFTSEVVMLLLNNRMEYLDCVSVCEVDYESGAVRAEPFIDAAIKSRAVVAIIAHNHPYGPPFPTVGDRATSNMMAESMEKAGILLAEHYVVSGTRFVGFMNNLSTAFSQFCNVNRFFDSKRNAKTEAER